MRAPIASLAVLAVLAACAAAFTARIAARTADAQVRVSPATPYGQRVAKGTRLEKATFGAGCFWGVEAAFRRVEGVTSTRVGFIGGRTRNPSYHDVCAGDTGHAEAVEITYDPAAVTYARLLEVFWDEHDPTTLNRQGPDIGDQYRSVIFYHTPEQRQAAEDSKKQLAGSGKYRGPIVTAIEPAGEFWQAEDYHQQYLEKRGLASCRVR